jgi:hypothetical protein
MVRYTAWLALPGTMAASSLQPCFSAVNKFFRDHQRQPIAVGELLADARRGLEMLQHRLVPADTRLPLLAPVALTIMLAANASHLLKPPPTGEPRPQFPHGSPSPSARSTRPRPPAFNGHRTACGKELLPLSAASARPSP